MLGPPQIKGVSPDAGWPGGIAANGTPIQGTPVIIYGNNFHPTVEMHRNKVSFTNAAGGEVPAVVEWASINEIDYIADRVVVRSADIPGGLDSPRGVAVDHQNGNLYISDTGHHRIVRLGTDGSIITWGTQGSAPGQFNHPCGLSVDANGSIYVADQANHRIQKFDRAGNFVTTWGSQGSGLGQYDQPMDVDVTILGGQTFVYVADSNNRRVARTDENGHQPTQFLTPAGSGSVLGVSAPRGYGHVYATDFQRIYQWTWYGPFIGDFQISGMGITQDLDGYVYVVDNGAKLVRKFDPFDPSFRQIAHFGLSEAQIPVLKTPEEELVDPVDLAVTNYKAVYVVDRQRGQVVRYISRDSQELWVHVPEGAASGQVRVLTDSGGHAHPFKIWKRGKVAVKDAYLTQGLVEYRLVAGKKTMIRYQLITVGADMPGEYSWGSPVHDRAECRVFKDDLEVGRVQGEPQFLNMSGGSFHEVGFEIYFEVPYWLVNNAGNYKFQVILERTGTPSFSDIRSFKGAFYNRKTYEILSIPITHLLKDGKRVSPGDVSGALNYLGSDIGHCLDWLDWGQLSSGYLHYNRIFPIRYSVGDFHAGGIWINNSMHDGINSTGETIKILEVLERWRIMRNQGSGTQYDHVLGVIDRREIRKESDPENMNWIGVATPGVQAVLGSIDPTATGPLDYYLGSTIAHELSHKHGLDDHNTRELVQTAKEAWNSVTGEFIPDPVTLMWYARHPDKFTFAEPQYQGQPSEYDKLFDALANPHPRTFQQREALLSPEARPPGCRRTFTLIGILTVQGEFQRSDSWLGPGTTRVTLEASDSEDFLVFYDVGGQELLRWRVRLSFGLQTLTQSGEQEVKATDMALASWTVPFPEATTRVVLVVAGRSVWEAEVPVQGPTVRLLTPRGEGRQVYEEPLVIEWQGSHPQGLELTYSLHYSSDGGQTFRPLALGLKDTRCEYPSGLASGTGRIRVRVAACDGFNQAVDTSDDIEVEELLTQVIIVQPRRGEIIPEGQSLHLLAMASHPDQGAVELTSADTCWILDNMVVLGTGNDLVVGDVALITPKGKFAAPVPVGPHRLRVEVTLAPGKIISEEIPIVIAADSDRDGIPDEVAETKDIDPRDSGDRPTVAPRYPFGQWRFHDKHTHTLYQISHLMAGTAILEIGFIDEQGKPLSGHTFQVDDGVRVQTIYSDREGWIKIQMDTMQTLLLRVAADARRPRGFGSSWLRVAKGSPLTETVIQAHAWMRYGRRFGWFSPDSESTVFINEGRPMKVRGALTWSGVSPRMALPELNYRVLGRLQMAANLLRATESGLVNKKS
jgi:DNA-binding beta-propeller fold protein YncE